MNTFVPFTATRKTMITTTKALLTSPDNQKPGRNHYGNKLPKLFFRDYLLYAVLRGVDYRKACHEESLGWAESELKYLRNEVTGYLGEHKRHYVNQVGRYIPEEGGDAAELLALIEAALTTPGA